MIKIFSKYVNATSDGPSVGMICVRGRMIVLGIMFVDSPGSSRKGAPIKLYGETPDISILLLYTFYQPTPTTNVFPALVMRELHSGLVLVNMLAMPLPTTSWMQIQGRSTRDLQ